MPCFTLSWRFFVGALSPSLERSELLDYVVGQDGVRVDAEEKLRLPPLWYSLR